MLGMAQPPRKDSLRCGFGRQILAFCTSAKRQPARLEKRQSESNPIVEWSRRLSCGVDDDLAWTASSENSAVRIKLGFEAVQRRHQSAGFSVKFHGLRIECPAVVPRKSLPRSFPRAGQILFNSGNPVIPVLFRESSGHRLGAAGFL